MAAKKPSTGSTPIVAKPAPVPSPSDDYERQLSQQLEQDKGINQSVDNTGKLDPNDPNVPLWQQYGFSSQDAYNSTYGSIPGASGGGAPGSPGGAPGTPGGPQQHTSDPFSDYLVNNPNAKDAWSYLSTLLDSYGLGSLDDFAKNVIVQGYSSNEVLQRLRETDTYKQRFATIEQLKAKGLPAMSEADVINTEKAYTQVLQQAGLPSGFYDQPEDFTQLMVNGVSPAEFQTRVINGYQAAMNADPQTKAELQRLYGVDDGSLAAYYLDPTRTTDLLTRQFTSAQIAGAADRTGYGAITAQQAQGLTALGVTGDQASAGFNDLAAKHELFQGLPGQDGVSVDRDTQMAAEFNKDAAAQQIIKRQAEARLSQFSGQTQFANDKTGFTGIGTAR